MTCIVYRAGIMAADSRAYGGDKVPIGRKCKIRRLPDGTLLGVTSTIVGVPGMVMDWAAEGCPKPDGDFPDNFTLLMVKPDGMAFMANNKPLLTGPLEAPYLAVGSGEEYALGAMAYSELCNAVEAVRTACVLDCWSDLPIHATSHCGKMPKLLSKLPPDQLVWLK